MIEEKIGEWIRLAYLEPDHETIQRRWAGVEKDGEGLDVAGALELAMLFHGLPAAEENTGWVDRRCRSINGLIDREAIVSIPPVE